MNKRTIIISIIAGLLAIGGGIVFYIQRALTFAPLPTYNTSIMSGKPEGASCINKSRSSGIAIELIDLGADRVYRAGGSNPMTLEEWNNRTHFKIRLTHHRMIATRQNARELCR